MERHHLEEKAYLAVERLKNLQRPENENDISQSMPDGGRSIGLYSRDFGMEIWDWPQGVGLFGMLRLHGAGKDQKILDYIVAWYRKHLSSGLPARNINTSAPMFTMSFLLDTLGQDAKNACDGWAEWLIESLPRTKDGGFQHTTTGNPAEGSVNLNEGQVWIDTLFMAVLFLAKYGVETGNSQYTDEAVHQFLFHIKYLYEKTAGLFYHGFTFLENNNFGGIFWCRGNCWYTVAVMELLEIMGDRLDGGTRQFLLDAFRSQIDALRKYQSQSGLWHTVIDDPASYEEVSGSAGFAYGILKGIRMGYLQTEYRDMADKAIEAIIRNIREDGTVMNVSAGTSMGYNADHYKNIMTAPMAYGQSLVVMALSESMK